MTKQHVNINIFNYDEEKFQGKLKAATLSYINDPTNYDRVVMPITLAFYDVEEQAIKGIRLSSKIKPKVTSEGVVMFFEGSEYKEGKGSLSERVKTAYELELAQIKKQQQAILEEQIYQQSVKAEEDKIIKADEKRKKDAKVRAEKYFNSLN